MLNTLPQIDTRTIWTIDPMHSQLEFKIKHMMITTVKGQFIGLRGKLVEDLEHPRLLSLRPSVRPGGRRPAGRPRERGRSRGRPRGCTGRRGEG